MTPFVHLHVHTEYSLLDSLLRIGPLIERVAELDMPAVAITDSGVLYGVHEFHRRAKAKGLRPILGVEIELAPRPPAAFRPLDAAGPGLVLLAETQEGWTGLMELVSEAHLSTPEPGRPLVSEASLARRAKGLIALSGGGNGEVNRHCAADRAGRAVEAAGRYAEIFGRDGFFLELQNQGLPDQPLALARLREVARVTGLKTVATNNAHYHRPSDARAHEVLRMVRRGASRGAAAGESGYSDRFHLRSAEEMAAAFPDDSDALRRTAEIAERCTAVLWPPQSLHFPRFEIPAEFEPEPVRGRNLRYLRSLALEGLARRIGGGGPARAGADRAAAAARLDREIDAIRAAGFVRYMLVMADLVRRARARGIVLGPGRDPAAGSLLAYCLGITEIDPLRHGLSFERFLNREAIELPRIEIEAPPSRRAEVVDLLRERYGAEHVAHITTFAAFGARMAIRDTGRALEVPQPVCDSLARRVPEGPDVTLARLFRERPGFRLEMDAACAGFSGFAMAFEGLPRNPGTHPTGIVVSDEPLARLVPLARSADGTVVTQTGAQDLASAGLLRIDITGSRLAAVLEEAVGHLRGTGGVPDPEALPDDDPEAMALLNRGDTGGIITLDAAEVRETLCRAGVEGQADLVALYALARPSASTLLERYIARKRGEQPVDIRPAVLRPVLEETRGLAIHAEQVQFLAEALAGLTPELGDRIRRAAEDQDDAALARLRKLFLTGCGKKRRMAAKKAEKWFDGLVLTSRTAASKASSVSAAILAARCAWLKAHHPLAFYAGALTAESGDAARFAALLAEVRGRGVRLLGPDINLSAEGFAPEGDALRYGLGVVRGAGGETARQWIAERSHNGAFKGLMDFCRRVAPHGSLRRPVELLIRAGAFDSTGLPRSRLSGGLEIALAAAGDLRDVRRGQGLLFDQEALGQPDDAVLPAISPWPASRRIADERELLGAPVTEHPLLRFEWFVRAARFTALNEILAAPHSVPVRMAALVLRAPAPEPDGAVAAGIDTPDGVARVVLPPAVFARDGAFAAEGKPVMVDGRGSVEGGEARIDARRIEPLERFIDGGVAEVRLHLAPALGAEPQINALKEIVARHPGPVPVAITVEDPQGRKVVIEAGSSLAVKPSAAFAREVETLLGEFGLFLRTSDGARE